MNRRALCTFALVWLVLATCVAQAPSRETLAVGRALVSYDKALPLNAEVKETTPRQYHVLFNSTHGERVPATLWLPEGKTGKLPAVILMHGLGGNKETMKPFADWLTKQGFACIAIDAKYHGERAKGPAGYSLFKFPYDARDAFAQTVVDIRRELDYLASRDDIDMHRIGYIGYSMGSLLGSIAAGADDRIACTVLVVGGGNWDALASKSVLPLAGEVNLHDAAIRKKVVDALAPLDPASWVGQISPRPVLMINGEKDNIVPAECSKALHAAAKEPKKVVWYPGGHGAPPDLLIKEIQAWFGKYLKP